MRTSRPSHRPVNQRDNYRPGVEDTDRVYERRGRSKSRERRRTSPPPRGRTDSWRSPADTREHDRLAPSRRERERSTESKRSGRPLSPSPHRSSRIEKDRARSPDMEDSRHSRHSHRRRSPTPPSKRRRSVSPYPSAKKPSKKSKRPRSPPPRPGSPSRRGRPRDSSSSPRRAISPRTRKMDVRPSTRGSERSRSPVSHVRRRSLSPRSQRQGSVTRRSPPPSHHRHSPRPLSRRYSPGSSRRSPDSRRRTPPPPRKRREPPGLSPRHQSPTSPKRRRISRSPRTDISPHSTTHDTLSKERKSDRDNTSNLSRKNERDSIFNTTKKETSHRYSKTTSPVRPKSPAGNSQNSIRKPPTAESAKTRTPPQPIPSFEGHTGDPQNTTNHENEYDNASDISRPGPESERHSESPSSSDYRPPPHFNPDRAARIKDRFKPKGWNEIPTNIANSEPLYTRQKTSQAHGFTGAISTPQGQGHGSAAFYQQQNPQSQYGSNTQMHGQYQQSYRNVNQPGGFRPNQFTPVVEQGHRPPTQHGFQIQAPPSQPRGRPINVFVGPSNRLGARGRYDAPRHSLLPPPPPASSLPPAPEGADSPTDPDDNPYRPASFRVQDELEGEEQESVNSTPTKPQASRSVPQQPASMAPPTEPKNMQQAPDPAHMPPPQQARPNTIPSKRRTPTHPASENSKGFRPFSLNLSKSRNPVRTEPSQRLRSLTAREKATDPAPLQSAGAEATSQVVEALKAISGPSQMAPPTVQTPIPQTPVTPLPQNPNDPHRFSVYERVTMVGEGTYGKVYKAKNKNTQELVALKRIRMESERDGFPITAVREMKLLESLKHINIVSLLETMVERVPTKTHSDFYMVFEYMDHDLTGILNHPTFQLEPGHIKHLAKQFFEGLQYLHHRGVLHRDIKASNILLDSNGLLKLADFGLARFYQKRKKGLDYTNRIITLWYRPPEILLGDTAYGPAVDIWSAGCVFAELFTRVAVFPGSTEINQLDVIYDLLGTPTKEDWPMLTKMPWYELLKPPTRKEPKFDEKYSSSLPPAALKLVKWIFSFDPEKRPSAEQVLQHAYFTSEEPEAKPCSLVHLKGDWHEFEAKSRKRKERQAAKEREAQASRREASSTGSGGPSTEPRQR